MNERESDAEAAVAGTRDLRRSATRRDITNAAVDLFERQGVTATSVDEIAAAAGIAPRTFYRHAETKENALFVDDHSIDVLLASVRAAEPTAPAVIRAIEDAYLSGIDAFDALPAEERERVLRIRRLILSDPRLLARALTREEELADELTALVVAAAGPDAVTEIQARTVVTAVGTSFRLAYDEWARRAERGETVSTRELYVGIRAGLRGYFGG